jgi:hypothetical protein
MARTAGYYAGNHAYYSKRIEQSGSTKGRPDKTRNAILIDELRDQHGAYRAAYKDLFQYLIQTGLSDCFPGVLEVVKRDVWARRYFRELFAMAELFNNDF